MATYTVELFGLPNDLAGMRRVKVELDDPATLAELVGALRRQRPALEGKVIRPGEDALASHYVFNVNGRFYVGEYDAEIRAGDHILIVTFALGG